MIEPILDQLEPLIVDELYRANLVNPPFHSSHEGLAILEEEVEEAMESVDIVKHLFSTLKNDVFHDRHDEAIRDVVQLRKHTKHAIAELVQVAAMCDKWGGSNG